MPCNESQTCVLTPWDYARSMRVGGAGKTICDLPLIDDRIDATFVKLHDR